jgi:adenosylhomocysteine nucleosidase
VSDRGDIVVLAAMPRELRPLVRRLRLRAGTVRGLPAWFGQGVAAAAVGVGPTRAGDGSAAVLDELAPRRAFVTGVAGAVDPTLKVGDVVRPARVVDVRSARSFSPHSSGPRSGVLGTVERVFLDGGDTHTADPALPDGTTAVDMETAAIAAVAEARGVPWDVVRAISDVAGTLTPKIAAILRPDGRADLPAAARLVLRDPRVVRRLARLGVDTTRAVQAATAALAAELAAEAAGEASR